MNLMRYAFFTTALLWLLIPTGQAQPADWTPLLEPEQLNRLLQRHDEIRVLQVTGDYNAGHIDGALNAPYARFRGPANNAGQLPPLQDLQALVSELGLNISTPVVLVHQGNSASDMGAATRVYWTLKSLGLQHLAILNGGLLGWREASLPVTQIPASVEPSSFNPQWQDTWRISTATLETQINRNNLNLIDARPLAFYLGEQATAARPGTLPGADNITYETWFDGNRMKPLSELQGLFASQLPSADAAPVSFCNTGHWASINWFVMSELAGIPDTRLYAESMVEWAQQPRPMANQPGRLAHYWALTSDWLRALAGW